MIERGITRTVLLVGRWAIKVPSLRSHGDGLAGVLWSFARGVSANLSERQWSSYGQAVCPVIWSFGGIINVYPRCEPVTAELSDEEYDAIGLMGPTDRKSHNVGVLNGRRVWVDYDQNWNDRPPCVCIHGERREQS